MSTVEPIRNKADIKKVENILSIQSKRDLLLFEIGINCGLRISDILRLNVGDVRDKTHIQIVEKKTGKFKKFPINSKLKPMIDDFIKGRRNKESVGTHTMRKTFGYHHYKMFKDVVMLQKIFNHSSPQITLRYIGVEQDEIDDSYKNFVL